MKKLYIIILAVLSVAVSTVDISDWEEHYNIINSCGVPIEIFHVSGYVGMFEREFALISKKLMMKSVVNDCKYDVFLEYDVSQEVFEEQIVASGFKIVGTRPIAIHSIINLLNFKLNGFYS